MRIAITFGIAVFIVLFAGVAHAACPVTIQAQNTQSLLAEVPQLNTDLQSCPSNVPTQAQRFLGNGNLQVNILMRTGTTQSLCVASANNQITGVTAGTCTAKFTMTISESNLDAVLSSTSRGTALWRLFGQGAVTIRPNAFFTRVAFFFVKPFVKSAAKKPAAPTGYPGPPAHCDETYMEGHEGYQYAKALWDSYKADTDGVCQMQQGYMNDAHCVYGVQQSRGGIPYYLCFYRN